MYGKSMKILLIPIQLAFLTLEIDILCTVEPLYNRHIGGRTLVLCIEVIPISEVAT